MIEPIRLPLRKIKFEEYINSTGGIIDDAQGRVSDANVDLNEFVCMFVNQAMKEMRDALNKYHSVSEMICRKELSVFFRQKAADFECLFILLSGAEYLRNSRSNEYRMKMISHADHAYVRIADDLAYVFESLKPMIAPKGDVFTCLQANLDPDYLLPKLYEPSNSSVSDEDKCNSMEVEDGIEFEQMHRASKIYLGREDLSIYRNVKVENGMVYLKDEHFLFTLALCGDISKPQWKLIDVQGEDDAFSRHLLFCMPSSVSAISRFSRVYESHFRMRQMFLVVKAASERIDMEVNGHYRRFEVVVGKFKMSVKIEEHTILGWIYVGNEKARIGENDMQGCVNGIQRNAIDEFECWISNYLCKDGTDARFSFINGFVASGRSFRSALDLEMFLDKDRENSVFYEFFENTFRGVHEGIGQRCEVFRNYRSELFGKKNVFITKSRIFLCVCLVGLTNTCMNLKVYAGSHELMDFFDYVEVLLRIDANGRVIGVANLNSNENNDVLDIANGMLTSQAIPIESVYEYFIQSMEILFFVHNACCIANQVVVVMDRIIVNHEMHGGRLCVVVSLNEQNLVVCVDFEASAGFPALLNAPLERMVRIDAFEEYMRFAICMIDIKMDFENKEGRAELGSMNSIGIVSMEVERGLDIRLTGMDMNLSFNDFEGKMNLEVNTLGMNDVFECIPKTNAVDILICFYEFFLKGFIPCVCTSSGLVFKFRYASQGTLRLKMVSRSAYKVCVEGLNGDFNEFSGISIGMNAQLLQKLDQLYYDERIQHIASLARIEYEVQDESRKVVIVTPCGQFNISVNGNTWDFAIMLNTMKLNEEVLSTICMYFNKELTIGRNISMMLGYLRSDIYILRLIEKLGLQIR
ncbi:hypothetical protein CWI40_090710 [Ordospora colligata]|nr:hypothetical protein CWI40_090710 [Ordospora colligata]